MKHLSHAAGFSVLSIRARALEVGFGSLGRSMFLLLSIFFGRNMGSGRKQAREN